MYPFTYWSPLYVVYTPESVTIPRPFDVMRTLYRRGTDASQSREYPVLPFLFFLFFLLPLFHHICTVHARIRLLIDSSA